MPITINRVRNGSVGDRGCRSLRTRVESDEPRAEKPNDGAREPASTSWSKARAYAALELVPDNIGDFN